MLYAIRATDRRGAIITGTDLSVEESPERRAVEKDVCAAIDILRETHATRLVAASTPREIRVAEPGIRDPGTGSVLQGAGALPVCRLGLLQAREDVMRVMQVIVVEGVVFEGGSCEPGCLCGFDEETAARGDVLMATAFERVVGCPAPHVFYVGG